MKKVWNNEWIYNETRTIEVFIVRFKALIEQNERKTEELH